MSYTYFSFFKILKILKFLISFLKKCFFLVKMLYWLINVILNIFNKRLRNFEINKMKFIDFNLKQYGNYIIHFLKYFFI